MMIATISILVIAGLSTNIDAKTFTDRLTMKGSFIDVSSENTPEGKITVMISEIWNSNDLNVVYNIRDSSGVISKGDCISPKQTLNVNGQKKASFEFDTNDFEDSCKKGVNGVISASVKATEDSATKSKLDIRNCLNCPSEIEEWTWRHGSVETVSAVGESTAFGTTMDVDGIFGKENSKKDFYTIP